MNNKKKKTAAIAGLTLACFFVMYGAFRGEAGVVFHKAVNICFECIGLG